MSFAQPLGNKEGRYDGRSQQAQHSFKDSFKGNKTHPSPASDIFVVSCPLSLELVQTIRSGVDVETAKAWSRAGVNVEIAVSPPSTRGVLPKAQKQSQSQAKPLSQTLNLNVKNCPKDASNCNQCMQSQK